MKKSFLFLVALALYPSVMRGKTAPKQTDFSGEWILDMSQTEDLPNGLQSYRMAVSQDHQQLKVQTTVRGDLRSRRSLDQPYPGASPKSGTPNGYPSGSPNGYPNGGWGRMGMPGRTGMGMPGGGTEGPMSERMPESGLPNTTAGKPRAESQSRGQIAAFTLYPRTAVYKLDGSESTAQLGGPMRGDVALKADWTKGGKVLKLSLTGSGQRGQIQMKDQWKLSKDGKSLIIDRVVESPHGSASVHLVFRK